MRCVSVLCRVVIAELYRNRTCEPVLIYKCVCVCVCESAWCMSGLWCMCLYVWVLGS